MGIAALFTLSIIFELNIDSVSYWQNENNMRRTVLIYYVAVISYGCGKLLLFSFFIIRVCNVFDDSIYELSKRTIVTLIGLMFIVCSMPIYSMSDLLFTEHYYQLFLAMTVLEMFLVITILYLFVNRLNKLVLSQKSDQ